MATNKLMRLDPTRTTTLRRKYEADMRKRFNKIKSLVTQAVWRQDVFGLNESKPLQFNQSFISNQVPEFQAWRFRTDDQKISSFNSWLTDEVTQENLFTTGVTGKPWQATYIDSAYRQGVVRSYNETRKLDLLDDTDFYQGSRAQFLESSFAQAERLGKLKFLYTRSFEELKGISAAMAQQLNRVLASGIANGFGARQIARQMSGTITGITRQRALVLARTELIAAHAEGQLDSFQQLGVDELNVMAEWSTAGDDLVCPVCEPLDGSVFTVEEARGLIPRHPNCRCAWIPANVGERGTAKRRAETQRKINDSIIAETRKKLGLPEAVSKSRWQGKRLASKYSTATKDMTLDDLAKIFGEDSVKGWSKQDIIDAIDTAVGSLGEITIEQANKLYDLVEGKAKKSVAPAKKKFTSKVKKRKAPKKLTKKAYQEKVDDIYLDLTEGAYNEIEYNRLISELDELKPSSVPYPDLMDTSHIPKTEYTEYTDAATRARAELFRSNNKNYQRYLDLDAQYGLGQLDIVGYTDNMEYLDQYLEAFNDAIEIALRRDTLEQLEARYYTSRIRMSNTRNVGLNSSPNAVGSFEYLSDSMRLANNYYDPEDILAQRQLNIRGAHTVDTTYQGTVRHEFGHAVQTGFPPEIQIEWEDLVLDNPDVLTSVSNYGSTNNSELFAESFSAYTSPSYERGFLPQAIEDYMDKYIGELL